MNYVLNDENGRKTVIKDEIINVGNGVKVFVDPVAIFNITGTEMDFIEDELKSEFTFNNPKSNAVVERVLMYENKVLINSSKKRLFIIWIISSWRKRHSHSSI